MNLWRRFVERLRRSVVGYPTTRRSKTKTPAIAPHVFYHHCLNCAENKLRDRFKAMEIIMALKPGKYESPLCKETWTKEFIPAARSCSAIILALAILIGFDASAQTVSRHVSWKYDFVSNPFVTGFELIYYAGLATNTVELPRVLQTDLTLTLGTRYDFELRAIATISGGTVKSLPATAFHIALPATPDFIQTNILIEATTNAWWQSSPDLKTWSSLPMTNMQVNIAAIPGIQFFRVAGPGSMSSAIRNTKLKLWKTL